MNLRLATFVFLTIAFSCLGAVVLFGTIENIYSLLFGGLIWGIVGIFIFAGLFMSSVFPSFDPTTTDAPLWFRDLLDNKDPLSSAVFAGILPVGAVVFVFFSFFIGLCLILCFLVMVVMLKPPAHDPFPPSRDNFADG